MQKAAAFCADGKNTVLIVPEQLSITRERQIHSGGIKNVQVLSFTRFANTVFRTLGGTAKKHPDSAMCAAAVFCAVERVYKNLTYFKRTAFTPGFIMALTSAFSEFDQNCLTEADVMSIPDSDLGAGAKHRYRDLFLIYREYKSMWADEYKDPSADLTDAASMLELNDIYTDTVFMFDGFFGFTEQQLRLIAQIIRQSPLCMFAFTTDMDSEVFTTVTKEAKKLERLCKKQGVSFSYVNAGTVPQRFSSPALLTAERRGFDMSDYESDVPLEGITVFEASNINEELGFIAARIKNDVLSGKYRYRDVAVLCPAADSVRYLAATVFENHGIPVFIDTSRALITQPLCAFVTTAFEIATRGFEPEHVFPFLKTGMCGIGFDDISLLENYVRLWKIRGAAWQTEWTQNPRGLADELKAEDGERLLRLNKLRESVVGPLGRFKAAISKKCTVSQYLRAIYDLTEEFNICDNLEALATAFKASGNLQLADEYTRVYGVFIDMLDSIFACCGERYFDKKHFYDMFCVCAGSVTVPGRPSRADEVLFAPTGSARPEDKKCVYIPCMNSAYIPSVRTPSLLITDADKRVFERYDIAVSLNIEMSAMRERFDFYSAVCSPSDELVLTYSGFTPTGAEMARSEYLDAVQAASGVPTVLRSDLDPGFFLVSVAGAADEAARTGEAVVSRAIERKSGISMSETVKRDEPLADSVVEALYSRALRLSFSSMDTYVNCPFRFFIDYGLGAAELEPVEFEARDVGNFIHKGLENMLGKKYDISTEEKVSAAVNELSEEYYNTALADCAGRSERFDYTFRRAKESFESAAQSVAAEVRFSDFRPSEFELNISNVVKPMPLSDNYTLSLKGYIDRVDKTDDNLSKIVDYKTGKQQFSYDDMYNGLSLQLPIYAAAIREKDPATRIAAMYYLKSGAPQIKSSENGYSAEEYSAAVDAAYKRDGVFLRDGDVISRLDSSGRFFKDVNDDRKLSDAKMEWLIDYAKERVRLSGEGIVCGNTDISPLKGACDYCHYKQICKIEADDSRIRPREKPPKDYFTDPKPEKKKKEGKKCQEK